MSSNYDGYRMRARRDRGVVKLLTRTGSPIGIESEACELKAAMPPTISSDARSRREARPNNQNDVDYRWRRAQSGAKSIVMDC